MHNQQFELNINSALRIGEITITVVDIDQEDVCFRIEGLDDFEQLEVQSQQSSSEILRSTK